MLSTGGFYAPTIRHHQNTVYVVVCTNIIHPDDSSPYVSENFIVSTNDIWSDEWSDPVYFESSTFVASIQASSPTPMDALICKALQPQDQ